MTKHIEMSSTETRTIELETTTPELNRRGFLMTTAIVGGGLAVGVTFPSGEAQAATMNSKPWLPPVQGGVEIGSWVTIAPDNTIIVRITQSELGQQIFTSNAMMLCEELECDWSKVGVVYFDVTRHLLENCASSDHLGLMGL